MRVAYINVLYDNISLHNYVLVCVCDGAMFIHNLDYTKKKCVYGTLISFACIGVGSSGLGESSSPCGRIRTTDRRTSSSRCGMYSPDGPE